MSEHFKGGSIERIREFELYECFHHEFMKRISKIIQVEELVRNFRVIGDEPIRLNLEEWTEEDWEEDIWIWLDPDEQEYEEEGFWEESRGFRDLMEAITPHAVRNINTNGFTLSFSRISLPSAVAQAQAPRCFHEVAPVATCEMFCSSSAFFSQDRVSLGV